MSDKEFSAMSDLDSIALAAANGLAKRNAERERAHIQATQQRTKRDAERKRQQAEAQDEERREQQQAALKDEARGYYLMHNTWANREDFEKAWKLDKTKLIEQYTSFLGSVQPM
jgi:hypothetical protein